MSEPRDINEATETQIRHGTKKHPVMSTWGFEQLPPPGPLYHNGESVTPALTVLATIDKYTIERMKPILQDYPDYAKIFALVRHRYRSDQECAAAMGLTGYAPKTWKMRYPQFADDLALVMERMADLTLRRERLKVENLVKIATREARTLLETPWDALSDRLAQVKGRIISELWKGTGILRTPAGVEVNANEVNITWEQIVHAKVEAQERGVINALGEVVEGSYREV